MEAGVMTFVAHCTFLVVTLQTNEDRFHRHVFHRMTSLAMVFIDPLNQNLLSRSTGSFEI